jgi:hypothetical protein
MEESTNTEESMKPVMLVGVVLIVIGVLALACQGITYTTREKVIDLGPLQASVDKTKTIRLPPTSARWRWRAASGWSSSATGEPDRPSWWPPSSAWATSR